MGGFSLWHILIFAIILLLLFGGNRFSAMMGDVAKGLKSFKAGMADEDEQRRNDAAQRPAEPRQIPPQKPYDTQPIDITPREPRPADPAAPPPPRDDSAL
jgi:sec-independent protein translocase protein TatA